MYQHIVAKLIGGVIMTNNSERDEGVKYLQVTLLPIMMKEWHIDGEQLQEVLVKYNILPYIDVCYEHYNSMGIQGVLEDLQEFIELQGGKVV